MSLTITNTGNELRLFGNLNQETCKDVKKNVTSYLKKHSSVIINIDEVTSIDRTSLNSLAKLFEKASKTNKKISIQGVGCKEIYDELMNRSIV
ncbi:conserved hypothetical protein [Tenacibaculum litopenaei]|jgi:ABC-type transporter Mla MlaB component|uniref:STAS domain-containing protein n=1 Tax=Tenacibaculum litopenaei TaxID=396016 RepID=UPI003895FDE4